MRAFLCLTFSLLFFIANAQPTVSEVLLKDENERGLSDLLAFGNLYRVPWRYATGHPFLFTDVYQKEHVFVKGNQFEIELKYDLEYNYLVGLFLVDGFHQPVVLSPLAVDSFSLLGKSFVNGKILALDERQYYQSIYSGKQTLVFGYDKNFISEYSNLNPRGKYSQLEVTQWVNYQNNWFNVSTKSRLLKVFEPHKKEIKSFLKQHKWKYRLLTETQFKELFKFIDTLE